MSADNADVVVFGSQTPLNFSVRSTVVDVRPKTGQAPCVRGNLIAMVFAVSVPWIGCSQEGSPERVADAFAQAYFNEMNQEKAKEYTALGATAMLDKELADVAEVRRGGYTAADARESVSLKRGEASKREHRIRFPYEVIVRSGDAETVRDADVELSQIQGTWKVVRVGISARDKPPADGPPSQ